MPVTVSYTRENIQTYLSTCGFPTLLQVEAHVSEVLEGTRSLWAVPNIFVYLRFLCKTPGRCPYFRGTRRVLEPYLPSETYLSTCGFPTLLQVEAHVSEVLEGYLFQHGIIGCHPIRLISLYLKKGISWRSPITKRSCDSIYGCRKPDLKTKKIGATCQAWSPLSAHILRISNKHKKIAEVGNDNRFL